MKIEDTQEVGFKPFSITIESLDEARRLLILLSTPAAEIRRLSDEKYNEGVTKPKSFGDKGEWLALDTYMAAKGYK